MLMHSFKVICNKCSGSREITIHKTPIGETVDWREQSQPQPYTIISARKRLDNVWGFQCYCGNNDLLTEQEAKTFSNPASPKPQEINDIVKNLVVDKPKFQMVGI